ncbi:MAG: hypothetical protein ACR2MG_14460 [Pyrinomonadaceae bacterium]
MSIIYILGGLFLLVVSWRLLGYSSTEKGKKFFKARMSDYMDKGYADGVSSVNGIALALFAFTIGVVLIIVGFVKIFG